MLSKFLCLVAILRWALVKEHLWLSTCILLKDLSVMTGTQTHTVMNKPPELESVAIDGSATTHHNKYWGGDDDHIQIIEL